MSSKSFLGCKAPVSYLLLVTCWAPTILNIKSLNNPEVRKGIYIYLGSANIRNPITRVIRHFRKNKKLRWHIDYLTIGCAAQASLIIEGLTEAEAYETLINLSRMERKVEDLIIKPSLKGFGSSDTPRHITHLFEVENIKDPYTIISKLMQILAGVRGVNKVCVFLGNSNFM